MFRDCLKGAKIKVFHYGDKMLNIVKCEIYKNEERKPLTLTSLSKNMLNMPHRQINSSNMLF